MDDKKYADIIVPLPLDQLFTYEIPEDMQHRISVGMRVIVHFGTSRFCSGVVAEIHNRKPAVKPKAISLLLDDSPVVLPQQLQFWQFLSRYYCCKPGDVYNAAIPTAMKIESKTMLSIVPEMVEYHKDLTPGQQGVIESLADGQQHELSSFPTGKLRYVKQLIELGLITNNEKLSNAYKPKYTTILSLSEDYVDEKRQKEVLELLSRAKKQQEALLLFLSLSDGKQYIERESLIRRGVSQAVIKALADRNILVIERKEIERIDTTSTAKAVLPQLSTVQQRAFDEIENGFATHNTVVLHGVTSSGKTELYIHLIKKHIAAGQQVLMLVPEIGLTEQLSHRLKEHFGGDMGIYHSYCSNYERVETYNHQLSDKPFGLILGVRSSIFLPFKNLGLVIVDEEHDSGYKQTEPAPRYHARDAAIYLASLYGAKTVLGSATPSIDTYANCHFGKYALVTISERYGKSPLPRIEVIDLKESYKKRKIKGHFSLELYDKITETLAAGEQVILFQNRRGFAPYVECRECGYVPRCPNCDVSMTYHKGSNALSCHYCGHTRPLPQLCPNCNKPTLKTHGFGTEQIEEETRFFFPDARIARLDLDTTRSAKSFNNIFTSLTNGETDIVIGTQMITKGLDFDKVGLVGILNADNLFNHPDFRAYERAFQMLTQVAGRAGRRDKEGVVFLQTSQPDNPIIQQIKGNDYAGFFATQMIERHTFRYPPYYRLIRIIIRHKDKNICNMAAERLASRLRLRFGQRVLGPDTPPVACVRNMHIRQILLKIEVRASIAQAKSIIMDEFNAMRAIKPFNTAQYILDIDPQ